MILAPASTAFAHSCCASSIDFPVAIDCAETARIPVASSSVRLAWKTRLGSAIVLRSAFGCAKAPIPGLATARASMWLEGKLGRERLRLTEADGRQARLAASFEPRAAGERNHHSWLEARDRSFSVDSSGLAHAMHAVKDGAHIAFGIIRKVMSRLKISAISYLNTAPLMWDFEHSGAAASIDFDISYTIPSACAEALGAGTADIGIIPAAAYATIPDLVVIPDVAIAARRAVRSILLVSRRPVDTGRRPK